MLYDVFYLVKTSADSDPVTSICKFSRFYNPDISDFVWRFLTLLTLFCLFVEVLEEFEVLFVLEAVLNMKC